MEKVFGNRVVCVAAQLLFALALLINGLSHSWQRASGPVAPPDPRPGAKLELASGPVAPPDPRPGAKRQLASARIELVSGPVAPPDPRPGAKVRGI